MEHALGAGFGIIWKHAPAAHGASNRAAIAGKRDSGLFSYGSVNFGNFILMALRVDNGERRHVYEAPDRNRWRQNMHGLRNAEQNWSDLQGVAKRLYHGQRDIGRIQSRHDKEIGFSGHLRIWKYLFAELFIQGYVRVHFPFNLEFGVALTKKLRRTAHLSRGRRFA